jgi:hypothetical protein
LSLLVVVEEEVILVAVAVRVVIERVQVFQ